MPSAAERTRTLVQGTCSAVLIVPGADRARHEQLMPDARTVGTEGEIFLLFPADAPVVRAATHAQDDELPAVLELTDVAPVAVPNRIRGRAWVSGWVTCAPGVAEEPGRMMLRLEVGELYVDDLWGDAAVDPDEFARAEPDPLSPYETELLQHLAAAHHDQVRGLRTLLGERPGSGHPAVTHVVPLALDRFGLRVRCRDEAGIAFDARFDFPEPVREVHGLRRAMHRLFEAAAEE
ncbi:DUF2470 domain-containing protein [Streptomyces sp. LP05-1]|uniref:DUF2470 domain-containing protein n=1 Tax=Streptomyces pyxinae TaxID=2970734 RepID=A0ABT2CQL7_9ACTN|nr:DUF2470 domain-containing protein [Streptomyces sp. LP05-1]MCS0639727.1 DUF2470 domain-containing protein [Streptomyces sp. LP05-1]